jgi:hypothetical protein
LLLLCLAATAAVALSSVGHCLANCVTCEPNNLAVCKGAQPCEWGHYDPNATGSCSTLPTLRTLSHELTAKPSSSPDWSGDVSYSVCEYTYQGKKKAVEVLGIFGGVTAVSRTFTVLPGSQVLLLSFNLVRD